MDTDDLSNELYKAIFITSEKFHHDLTIQFGVLASECKDESDYIAKAESLIEVFQEDFENSIQDVFFERPPSKKSFIKVLQKIMVSVEKVKQIPIEKRHYDF